jgi:DNA repair protein RadC
MEIRYEAFEGAGLPVCASGREAARPLRFDRSERIANRSTAAAYIRSLPDSLANSSLALFLDREFGLLAMESLGRGNAADCVAKPYLLVRRACELRATGFLLVHYAPLRTSPPTPEERQTSRTLRKAGEDFDVHLLDHLIVSRDRLIDVSP